MKSEKETIYDYAAELKLLAFKEELECTLSLAAEENWNHLQFLTELLGKESARRRECRRRSRIRSAGFPQMKYLHELVMEDMPKEAQVILPELETLDFIRQGKKPGPVWKSGNRKDAYCYGFRNKGLPTGLYRIVYFSAGPAYPDKGG